MPTVMSHPAVALATSPCLGTVQQKPLAIVAGMILTVLPDLDVLAFRAGIPYRHIFGHRGFSHSILFALLASILFAFFNRQPKWSGRLMVWAYLFVCAASHGLLDAVTNGGLGVGFFIPFSAKRYFFEFRPIAVSTLSLDKFLNGQWIPVLRSELMMIWAPALVLFLCFYIGTQTRIKA